MTPLLVFAAPNPHFEQAAGEDLDYIRMQLLNAFVCGDGSIGASIYDMSRAIMGYDDPRLGQIHRAALASADLVFAYPGEHPSLAVAATVGAAQVLGVPVVIYRADDHPSLLGPNTHQFNHLHAALEYMRSIEFRPIDRRQVAQFTRTTNAVPPYQAHDDDAGFDLTYNGPEIVRIKAGSAEQVPCGVAIEFPPHTWGFLVGRSSTFHKRGLLVNPAIIDPGYRGELFANVRNIGHNSVDVAPGERIAQIIPLPALAPRMKMVEVERLSPTARGSNGFGSTGS